MFVDEQPHELGNGDGRMRVVQLDRDMVGQRRKLAVLRLVPPQQILQRCRREEELLAQPELVARGRLVAWIEHARDRLETHPVRERADVIAAVELLERDRIHRPRGPQAQRVDVMAAPARDRRVVRDGIDRLRRAPDIAGTAFSRRHDVDRAAESDRVCDLGPLEFPRIAGRQPVLGQLDLPAVAEHLPEDAVVIANAIAVRGNGKRRHAFHEARSESPEPAVAERGVGLEPAQAIEIDAEIP